MCWAYVARPSENEGARLIHMVKDAGIVGPERDRHLPPLLDAVVSGSKAARIVGVSNCRAKSDKRSGTW